MNAQQILIPTRRAAADKILPTKRTRSGLFLRELEVGPMHGRDRNKPCPCKSGRKFKRCHGRSQ